MSSVSKSQSDRKIKSFPKETVFSEKSCGHGKSSVDAAADILFAAVKTFFSLKPQKWSKLNIFNEKFLPLRVCYTKELQFWKPCRNEVAKPRIDLQSKFENDDKLCIFFSNLTFARIVSGTGGKHVWRKMLKSIFFCWKG